MRASLQRADAIGSIAPVAPSEAARSERVSDVLEPRPVDVAFASGLVFVLLRPGRSFARWSATADPCGSREVYWANTNVILAASVCPVPAPA